MAHRKKGMDHEMTTYLRFLLKIMLVLLTLNVLSGCWDIKEIQDMNYITAIGIDYEDGHFVVYTQMADFTSVAKTETGNSGKPAQIWTSTSRGKTLDMAINQLYDTAQQRTIWSHISSIIISEKVLKTQILSQLDTLSRYQEVRLTPWVFGTRESIEDLLTAPAFFNLSPLSTLSHEPLEEYKQKSYIVPLRYFDFLALMTEPACTALLPNITVDQKTWEKDKKPSPKLRVDGVFTIVKDSMGSIMTNDKLNGLRWVQTNTKRSPVLIMKDEEYAGVVVLQSPNIRKELKIVDGEPKYELHVKLDGNVVEALVDFTKSDYEREAAKIVRQEIIDTFRNGLKAKTDIYSLEHILFKQESGLWKKLKQTSPLIIDEDSLAVVQVDVHLDHVGMKLLPRRD